MAESVTLNKQDGKTELTQINAALDTVLEGLPNLVANLEKSTTTEHDVYELAYATALCEWVGEQQAGGPIGEVAYSQAYENLDSSLAAGFSIYGNRRRAPSEHLGGVQIDYKPYKPLHDFSWSCRNTTQPVHSAPNTVVHTEREILGIGEYFKKMGICFLLAFIILTVVSNGIIDAGVAWIDDTLESIILSEEEVSEDIYNTEELSPEEKFREDMLWYKDSVVAGAVSLIKIVSILIALFIIVNTGIDVIWLMNPAIRKYIPPIFISEEAWWVGEEQKSVYFVEEEILKPKLAFVLDLMKYPSMQVSTETQEIVHGIEKRGFKNKSDFLTLAKIELQADLFNLRQAG